MASRDPDFGPSGYLPPRAANRARKIILREPLGLAWAAGAIVAGIAVLVAGVMLLGRLGPPGPPFVVAGPLAAVDARGAGVLALPGTADALVVRGAGGVAVFTAPVVPVRWCPASSRLEAADGRVWEPDGRLVGGSGPSLTRLPARVHDGVVHVDPTGGGARRPRVPGRAERPRCAR